MSRTRKPLEKGRDQGFTLIELLVVMIIIGILASIAIPVFLSQRAKAKDTATKSDVSRVGKEIAAYYVDGTTAVFVGVSGATATVYQGSNTSGPVITTVALSNGTALYPTAGAGQQTPSSTSTTWCVAFTNPAGSSNATWKFSATSGLGSGICP